MTKRLLVGLLLALVGMLAAAPAGAAKPSKQEQVLAKKAANEGRKHAKKGDWEEAREAWQRSVDLNDTPGARIELAKAESKLGRLLLAEEHIKKALEHPKLPWAQKRKATSALAELDEKIPTLGVEPPADFAGTISVNDQEYDAASLVKPLRLDPGEHTVQAKAKGYTPFSESVLLEEGDRKNLVILLTELPEPPPPPAPVEEAPKASGSTQQTLGWVSIAIGGVGLAVGSVMGLQARSTRSELDGACSNDVCSEEQRGLYDKGTNQANIATAGFIVGGVGIGLGTVLLLTAGKQEKKPAAPDEARLEPLIGPGRLGVRGTF
jgi:tetratricopeptide (TPR) repeat protein